MNRTMEDVKVSTTDDGNIRISQTFNMGEEDVVVVHPAQVDILIEWLNEVKSELLNHDS